MAADASSSKAATPSKESGSSQPPFRPPAGLPAGLGSTPSRKVMPLRKHRKTTALDRHRQWIHRIKQHQQRALQHNEQEVDTNLQHKERVRRFARNLRKQILSGADVSQIWRPAQQAATLRSSLQPNHASWRPALAECKPPQPLSQEQLAALDADMTAFVDGILARAAASSSQERAENSDPNASFRAHSTAGKDAAAVPEGSASQSLLKEAHAASARPGSSASCRSDASREQGHRQASHRHATPSSRPAWALSQPAAEAVEQTEEEELLSFAEDLDYDDYIKSLGDAELAEVLKEMKGAEEGGAGGDGKAWRKHFVRAMNHMAGWEAQGAAGRAACASVRSAAARSEAAESSITKLTESGRLKQQQAADKLAALQATKSAAEPVWDSSTKAGSDDVGVMAKVAKVHEAGEVLRENPEMRGVHSQASVAALLAKSASPATSQHASAQPVAVS